MILYLQKDFNGGFVVAMKNNDTLRDYLGCDYSGLLTLSREMTIKAVYELVQEKFGCKKLVLDF